jgi:hypothetical protein
VRHPAPTGCGVSPRVRSMAPTVVQLSPSRLDNLILAAEVPDSVRDQLSLRRSRRSTAVRRYADSEITCGAGDLVSISVHGSLPMRRFAWRKRQRHRPGLGSVMLPDNGFDSSSRLGQAHRRSSRPCQ